MRNFELDLRRPGQVLLLERGAAQALIERVMDGRLAPHSGGGLLSRALSMVGLKPRAMEDDDGNEPRIDTSRLALPQIDWAGTVEWGEGYAIVEGIAIIDIQGVLTPDGYIDWWSWCWVGGYSQIRGAVRAARADDRVQAILLRIDSPGGYVDGCFDLADEIAAGNAKAGGKPVWVNARMACSAAYALAAAGDHITALAEADVGSIGVLVLHVDVSGFYAEHGIKIEAIQSAPRKTDGAEWKPLSEDARAHLQAVVDQIARRFSATVTAGRGISADDIAALQARWFLARHDDPEMSGLALHLVDDIATDEAAFAALKASLANSNGGAPSGSGSEAASDAGRTNSTTESDMGLKEQIAALRDKAAKGDKAAMAELAEMGVSIKAASEDDEEKKDEEAAEDDKPADDDADKPADDEGDDETKDKEPSAKATGTKAGFALLRHKEAKGRAALANRLAEQVVSGKMSYGEAVDMLADAPKARPLSDAMQGRDRNPGNDAGGGAAKADAELGSAVDRMLSRQGKKAVG